jgi:hypothetical protein
MAPVVNNFVEICRRAHEKIVPPVFPIYFQTTFIPHSAIHWISLSPVVQYENWLENLIKYENMHDGWWRMEPNPNFQTSIHSTDSPQHHNPIQNLQICTYIHTYIYIMVKYPLEIKKHNNAYNRQLWNKTTLADVDLERHLSASTSISNLKSKFLH